MDKALRKHVFHEVEVAGVVFRVRLREGRFFFTSKTSAAAKPKSL